MLKTIIVIEVIAIAIAGAHLLHKRGIWVRSTISASAIDLPVQPLAAVSIEEAPPVGKVQAIDKASIGETDSKPLPSLHAPSVKISKSTFRLTVYQGGSAVKTYRVAIGGGKGDKVREGDRCTPEGEFIICMKNPQSKYVLALGLSYPNIEDAERGLRSGLINRGQYRAIVEAIRDGRQPPWDTPLGGEIMIHGKRGSRDKTKGCIALDDHEIRELYSALPVGTPVTIAP